MKRKKFKVIPFVTTLFLMFSLVYATATPVMATDTYTDGDFKYTIDVGDNASITGYTGNAETLQIPSKLGGKTVNKILSGSFAKHGSLINVTIPDNIVFIENGAFSDCDNLAEINVDENSNDYTSEDGILFTKNKEILMKYPCKKNNASYIIPNGVTIITSTAFNNCSNLTNITIPDTVTTIFSYTFDNCSSLKSVEIKSSLTNIGDTAFDGCPSIGNIIIYKDTNDTNSSEKTIKINGFPITIKLNTQTKIGIEAIKNGNATVADYKIEGFVGVDANNVDSINSAIASSKNEMINLTQGEIEYFIDQKISIIKNPGAVAIKGTETVGKTLEAVLMKDNSSKVTTSAGVNVTTPAGASIIPEYVQYKWYRLTSNNSVIGDLVGSDKTYKLVNVDKGSYIKLIVYNAYGEILGIATTGEIQGIVTPGETQGKSSSNSSSSSSSSHNETSINTSSSTKESKDAVVSDQIPNGWQKQSDNTWKYGENGQDIVGWKKVNGIWYSFASNGTMETGFKQEGGKTYYLDNEGAMATGWELVNGSWYLFDNVGAMLTGWAQVDGKWYYLNSTGVMATGWISLEGKWYYLYGDGSLAVSTVINGYTVDEKGVWIG